MRAIGFRSVTSRIAITRRPSWSRSRERSYAVVSFVICVTQSTGILHILDGRGWLEPKASYPNDRRCKATHGGLEEETIMNKIIILMALAFALAAGSVTMMTVHPQQATAWKSLVAFT
jgi:hypothetical protein